MDSEISDKASKMERVATLDEASALLRQIAGRRHADESVKGVLRRLQRKLSDWSPGRIKDVWYRDPRIRVRAEEVEQLRALARPADAIEASDELTELRTRVSRLEHLLEAARAPLPGSAPVEPWDQGSQVD
ncbi:hypothetical protein [Bradyrhizobium oligotrophicum]|uniref:hypothetical protein n=1 Tax=Bradyrhizobium oligotrophicum TaxID=44255 RepID=UPI003EC02983